MDFHNFMVGAQDQTVFTDILNMFQCHSENDPGYTEYCCHYCCYNGYNFDDWECLIPGSGDVNLPFWGNPAFAG